ncbi:hypothetical protein [Roseobacter sinensis]|uniref:NfeD-like C-terminal domain-containing protein n=1 Tax=Roseobacter sinensis TaxID=2931391 RepID=A0ABT3BGC3_9RHOB|nr:hypothetical protein [Roseobacter sp. WL0113]MCV3272613.1 hypothetical protein [Roseobacter sp. WL0113]
MALAFVQILILFWGVEETRVFFAERALRKGKVPTDRTVAEYDWYAIGVLSFGTFCAGVLYSCILVICIPMATTLVDRQPLLQVQVVTEVYHGSGTKGRNAIRFDGTHWLVGGLIEPPPEILDAAGVGDRVVLTGVGNRWGVFYDDIELIKQQ